VSELKSINKSENIRRLVEDKLSAYGAAEYHKNTIYDTT